MNENSFTHTHTQSGPLALWLPAILQPGRRLLTRQEGSEFMDVIRGLVGQSQLRVYIQTPSNTHRVDL